MSQLLRLWQVQKVFPASKSKIYKGIRDGLFPAPVKHGGCSFWREEDIDQLIKSISEEGDKK